ncbi:flavoprotein [Bacillus sp. PK3_68]|uniref:flavoprotein n=1 Tax=Bacillaceae TaxID=186817 RepID=UPI000E714290|nr:flavoprotein [Bacillus sp. PK3_68]RJS62354.1 flavoprotein [Bacillus sp. PK3_68]
MDSEEVIQAIVAEVWRRLQKRVKKATAFFTGGAYGFQEAIEQMKNLLKEEWELNILLSNSAEYVLTPRLIKEELGLSNVHVEHEVKSLKPYYEGVSTLIFPTLTLNTAVKISLGVADNLATNLASHAIMKGLPIIAARDGCDLRNPIREELGLHKAPPAYVDQIEGHLHALEDYGFKLIEAKNLSQAVRDHTLTIFRKEKVTDRFKEARDFKKKVLTRSDIIEAKQKSLILNVSSATIISPLALETAQELGIKVIRNE